MLPLISELFPYYSGKKVYDSLEQGQKHDVFSLALTIYELRYGKRYPLTNVNIRYSIKERNEERLEESQYKKFYHELR